MLLFRFGMIQYDMVLKSGSARLVVPGLGGPKAGTGPVWRKNEEMKNPV